MDGQSITKGKKINIKDQNLNIYFNNTELSSNMWDNYYQSNERTLMEHSKRQKWQSDIESLPEQLLFN